MYKKGISVFTGLKEYSLGENIEYLRKEKYILLPLFYESKMVNK